jgi:hypothetical protein
MNIDTVQLSQLVKQTRPEDVLKAVKKIFCYSYTASKFSIINKCFKMIKKLFLGKYPGYKKCNTEYHNLGHTMDAFLAASRLIDGYNIKEKKIGEALAVNLLLAALFHDTGYIQEIGDDDGTGAKYTKNHVERSVVFVMNNAFRLGLNSQSRELIAKIISCTGVRVEWDYIHFDTETEKITGAILGSADLLGQMSDRKYLEKLMFLYYEFKEAGIAGFDTEYDIIKNTVNFYQVTMDKFEDTYLGVYRYAQDHFRLRNDTDANLYMEAIDRQMNYLKKIIEDSSTNFRHKLKRMDVDGITGPRFHKYEFVN